MANFLFYLTAAGAVVTALGVVLARNPITSVISLLASFFCLSAIYLLAGFQFLAATQILVYAGAIMVLFLFVIMLLNLGTVGTLEPIDAKMMKRRHAGLALAIASGLLLSLTAAIITSGANEAPVTALPDGGDPLTPMAGAMFGRFLLPFEATSLLLLATAVAVLVLAKRDRAPRSSAPAGARASDLRTDPRASGVTARPSTTPPLTPAPRAGVHASAGAGERA